MMVAWIRFAFRNLLRNRRRSLYTMIAVAMGYAAINLFGGFTAYIFTNLRESFIYIEANGHLTIFKSVEAASQLLASSITDGFEPITMRNLRWVSAFSAFWSCPAQARIHWVSSVSISEAVSVMAYHLTPGATFARPAGLSGK